LKRCHILFSHFVVLKLEQIKSVMEIIQNNQIFIFNQSFSLKISPSARKTQISENVIIKLKK